MHKRQFSAGLSHLDEAMDRNLDQDHGMSQLHLKVEAVARRMREAFATNDRDRLDVEISYLASLADQAKALEQQDLLSHTSDRQIWWELRPFFAFKGADDGGAQ